MKSSVSATASASSSKAPPQRLPVNPRRKKVSPEERKRVATACNSCNVRRIKCSGGKPECEQCKHASRLCGYPTQVEKISIAKSEYEGLKADWHTFRREISKLTEISQIPLPPPIFSHLHGLKALRALDRTAVLGEAGAPGTPPGDGGEARAEEAIQGDDAMSLDGFSDPSNDSLHDVPEGRMLLDPHGTSRFHGETSGATFLDGIKDFISTTDALLSQAGLSHFAHTVGHYRTSDSQPLSHPVGVVDQPWLPPPAEAEAMLAKVRDFIMDGNGAYPSGGIYFWPLADLEAMRAALADPQDRCAAFYNAAFAFATLLSRTEPGSRVKGQLGEAYFARARELVGDPFDVDKYSMRDVPTLTLMALYHIENNRRESASAFISTAMNICRMNGIDRGSSADPAEHRVFWTLYILDRWLSCLMGRLPSIPDGAIRLPLPEECQGLPPVAGLRAHVELSYISNFIVHHSCNGARATESGPPLAVGVAHDLLDEWRRNLPEILNPVLEEDRGKLIPDADGVVQHVPIDNFLNKGSPNRAFCALHMAYNQLRILTVRPAYLAAMKKMVASGFIEGGHWDVEAVFPDKMYHLRDGADSARDNLLMADWLRKDKAKLLLQDLHHVFNAAVMLLMYQLVFSNLRTLDLPRIDFAIAVFEHEAKTGSSYGQDCFDVLNDLRGLIWPRGLRDTLHSLPRAQPQPQAEEEPLPGEQILSSLTSTDTPAAQSFPAGPLHHGRGRPEGRGVLLARDPNRPIPQRGTPMTAERRKVQSWLSVNEKELYSRPECMVDEYE